MKTKKVDSKLVLNKKTLVNLDSRELNAAKGGIETIPLTVCNCTDVDCSAMGCTVGPCAYTIDCPTYDTCPPGTIGC